MEEKGRARTHRLRNWVTHVKGGEGKKKGGGGTDHTRQCNEGKKYYICSVWEGKRQLLTEGKAACWKRPNKIITQPSSRLKKKEKLRHSSTGRFRDRKGLSSAVRKKEEGRGGKKYRD